MVFMERKVMAILGRALPYSLRIVFPKEIYSNKLTNNPKIRYPYGL